MESFVAEWESACTPTLQSCRITPDGAIDLAQEFAGPQHTVAGQWRAIAGGTSPGIARQEAFGRERQREVCVRREKGA
jgi:hypothetical protein